MKHLALGRSGLVVSEYALGTMTWGNQTDAATAHAQIDLALDHGITLIDTAEMYPTNPVRAETVGRTEAIIGDWIARSGRRDAVVLATKVTGPGRSEVREGAPVTPAALRAALEGSLRRLRTEVIDLYQIHWPNRGTYHFRGNWRYDPRGQDAAAIRAQMDEVLGTLAGFVAEGKVRAFGLSNETVWGTAAWLARAEATGGPRVAAIQNEYSLLCRLADTDMAELLVTEDIPLLAYSPLAMGLLSGKYAGDATPAGSRRATATNLAGRITPRVFAAVDAVLDIARRHGLEPCAMALAWVRSRPFPAIPLIGATTLDQLRTDLGALDLALPPEVLDALDAAHRAHPMPF